MPEHLGPPPHEEEGELGQGASEDAFAAAVDAVRAGRANPASLVDLLAERHPVYTGRSTNAVRRMKGYALATFEQVGLPDGALPFVLEELDSGLSPYLVAAAARALRGAPDPGTIDDAPRLLRRALANIEPVDDAISFDGYWATWPVTTSTTAVTELLATLALFEPFERATTGATSSSSCCSCSGPAADVIVGATSRGATALRHPPTVTPDALVEDQAGTTMRWRELVAGQPSVVAFFYTRCDNPNKCSLTITNLARLQRILRERGLADRVRLMAVTYDPAFDSPERLLAYGTARGIDFDEQTRLIRTTHGFEEVSRFFDLGVNFGPVVPNIHRIELYLLDPAGRIHITLTRRQWDPADVAGYVVEMLSAR